MSVKEETEKLKEKVVVDENETTEIAVTGVEPKTEKAKKIGKKVLKVAGVVGIGVLGFILGTKVKSRNDDSDETTGEVEYVEVDSNEDTTV